jgi:hypothetical protein
MRFLSKKRGSLPVSFTGRFGGRWKILLQEKGEKGTRFFNSPALNYKRHLGKGDAGKGDAIL